MVTMVENCCYGLCIELKKMGGANVKKCILMQNDGCGERKLFDQLGWGMESRRHKKS